MEGSGTIMALTVKDNLIYTRVKSGHLYTIDCDTFKTETQCIICLILLEFNHIK